MNTISYIVDKLLTSSEDSTKLSARVTGIIISASSYAVYLLALKGYNISDAQVQAVAGQFGTAIGSLWFVFGLIRWAVNEIGNKFLWNK